MRPYYKIKSPKPGETGRYESGKFMWDLHDSYPFLWRNFRWFLNFQVWTPATLHYSPKNHYRAEAPGTTLGFRGLNYWIPDDCAVGRILKFFFGRKGR